MNPNNLSQATSYNQLSDQYAGKSLDQIRDSGVSFRPDVLANLLGVSEKDPLKSGLTYNMATLPQEYNGNSSEGNAFRSLFSTPGQSPEQKAVQPAVNTLQASKAPIEQRYKDLLTQIKGQQGVAENRQTTATSNELGRRGITGGGLYDQQFVNALNPITQQYTGMYQNTANQENMDLNSVDQAISQLQAGAGNNSIQNALQQLQLSQQNNQFNQNFGLQQQQFDFQKQQYQNDPLGLGLRSF